MKINFSLLILILTQFSQISAQERFNGNFEQIDKNGNPTGWDLTYKNQNKYDIQLDSIIKSHGKYAVSIASNSKGQSSAIIYSFKKRYSG